MAARLRPACLRPAALLLAALLFVVTVVSLRTLPALAIANALALAGAWALAGNLRPLRALLWALPFGGVLALTLPFVTPGGHLVARLALGPWALPVTSAGLHRAAVLWLRLLPTVLVMAALRWRLGVPGLLEALAGLRVPGLFVSLVAFTLRYTEVLADEGRRMLVARRARGFAPRPRVLDRRSIATYGQLLGVLLTRAKERSERVYLAMLSRGYVAGSGRVRHRSLPVSPAEAALVAATLALAAALKLWERGLL